MSMGLTGTARMAAVFISILLLTGCDKHKSEPPAPDARTDVRRAAEAGIRLTSKDPNSVRFRGVQVYPQAIAGDLAVCGQTNVFGGSSQTYVPFVAVVNTNDATRDPPRRYRMAEASVASTVTEATRTYLNMVARCYDLGGPQPLPHDSVTPVPPLPEDMKSIQEAIMAPPPLPAPPVPPPSGAPPVAPRPASVSDRDAGAEYPAQGAKDEAAPDQTVSSGTVTMRQNGNIHDGPHGATVRIEPQGTVMHVFAEAPGGWLQVGDVSPFGWVHSSLVERHDVGALR